MKLIVGLGNPGINYKETRHNVGFMFVDKLCEQLKITLQLKHSFKCYIGEAVIGGEKFIIIKPITYMNNSGEAVLCVAKFYKIDNDDIIVIHDDMDLPTAKIRIRTKGSSGGQKGMKNIIDLLGTEAIKRIRIGIGHSPHEAVDYVLGKFSKDDKIAISLVTDQAKEMIECIQKESFENFMNRYNRHE